MMRKKQLFWIKILAGIIVSGLLLAGGFFSAQFLREKIPTTSRELFQNILAKNCDVSLGKIDPDLVPIKVDWGKLKLLGATELNIFSCGKYLAESGYTLGISLTEDRPGISVYDRHTVATAFGGTPDPEIVGSKIKDNGLVEIVVLLRLGEGPRIVGSLPVIMLGEKKITLPNGETIYASYELTAIEPNDPRLVSLLTEYSKPHYKEERELLSNIDRNLLIKNSFFSDLTKLGPSEKKALDEIELVLSAVSAK